MRVEALTFFRFVAAMIVVIFHFGPESSLASLAPGFLTAGSQMVSFFFVLSGFVLVLAYAERWKRCPKPWRFWQARVARIVPIYLLAFFLSLALFQDQPLTDARAVLLDLLFLQAWFPPYPLAVNGPAWSLSVEAFFYLIFPLCLWIVTRGAPRPARLMVGALTAWLFAQSVLANLLQPGFYAGFPSVSFDLIHYLPLTHLPSFGLGVAGGYWTVYHRDRVPTRPLPSLLLILVSGGAIVLALNLKDAYASLSGFSAPLHAGFFAPLFLALILAVAIADPRATRWLVARPLVLLGEASYGIYILQTPIGVDSVCALPCVGSDRTR